MYHLHVDPKKEKGKKKYSLPVSSLSPSAVANSSLGGMRCSVAIVPSPRDVAIDRAHSPLSHLSATHSCAHKLHLSAARPCAHKLHLPAAARMAQAASPSRPPETSSLAGALTARQARRPAAIARLPYRTRARARESSCLTSLALLFLARAANASSPH